LKTHDVTWQLTYNELVKIKTTYSDAVHLIRFAALLWIGYLAVLAIINQSLWIDPGRMMNVNTFYYYFLLALVALLCLGLSYWKWLQLKLGKTFLPILIGIITVLPMLVTWEIIRMFPHTPALDPQSSVTRLIPFFLVSFLLVAWRYKWPYMLLIVLAITGLNLAMIWSFPSREPDPFRGGLTATLIQAVVFLAVGFSISFLITRLRKQQQSLETANLNLTHYASTLDQLATSRERNRLARELHDTLAHTLSGLSVQLETIKAYWDIDQQAARSSLDKSLATARSGLEETRRALKALRASPLDDLGLVQGIKVLAEEQASRAKLHLDLIVPEQIPALSPDVEQCVYRITQEAITNVINHARAKNLTVKLEPVGSKVKLIVLDDGEGFEVEKNYKANHFGIHSMQERAQLIGGELIITSQPGLGTTIQLTV
jgi:signal transduction histidine kinase